MNESENLKSRLPFIFLCGVLMFNLLYGLYLAFVCQIIVVHDSISYEALGKIIHSQGWITFLKTGPHREPLYPFLVALAMSLADTFAVSYQTVLKFQQFFILWITQILLAILLWRTKVNRWIIALTVLYAGVSPALLNCALCLYSEIIILPWVIGIILASVWAWRKLSEGNTRMAACAGALIGILFSLATFSKALYEFISVAYLIIFAVFLCFAWRRMQCQSLRAAVVFILAFLGAFNTVIISYKALNAKFNGTFTLTDRGTWILYECTARRTEQLNWARLKAAYVYNIFEEDCPRFVDQADCTYWGTETVDEIGRLKVLEVSATTPPEKMNGVFMKLARERLIQAPLAYLLFMGADTLHQFFWETTRGGFVAYPDWLDRLYLKPWLFKPLRLGWGLMALLSFLYLGITSLRKKTLALPSENNVGAEYVTGLFLFTLLALHIGIYSFFVSIPRYSLPIAPLFLAGTALMFNAILKKISRS